MGPWSQLTPVFERAKQGRRGEKREGVIGVRDRRRCVLEGERARGMNGEKEHWQRIHASYQQ